MPCRWWPTSCATIRREVDWLVEPSFAAIPQMHPALNRVHTVAWRKWRGHLLDSATWAAMNLLRRTLREARYDLVLDLQGLLESALSARQRGAGGPAATRPARAKPRPPGFTSAVRRYPRSARGGSLPPARSCAPGLRRTGRAARVRLAGAGAFVAPAAAYSVLIPNASRPEKLWPERHWVAVGKHMRELGWTPVVLWGRPDEQTLAERIAADCEGDVPPFLKVGEMASVLAGARHVVGLDTGFTHLAAAFGRPTLGIYCDHEPGLAGVAGPGRVASIGGRGQVPSRSEVLALFEKQLAAA